MDAKLLAQGLAKALSGLLLTALLLFAPAGTLAWWEGWRFLGLLFLPMLVGGTVMFFKAPELLRRRLNVRERQAGQRRVILLSGAMFVAGFALAGLGVRFGWKALPRRASLLASAVFLAGYALFAEVLRENEYLSRTVEVAAGQRVVDTGLYGVVRHPMYAATLLMFLAMPLSLGSLPALIPFLAYPFILARRIAGEEALLLRELPGYDAYMGKVRWRLLPGVW